MIALRVSISLLLSFLTVAASPRRLHPSSSHSSRVDPRCKNFYDLRDDLQTNVFHNQCGGDVPDALRLAFHDAIGWSRSQNIGGGADGSLITFSQTELGYPENVDLDDIVETLTPYVAKYNISAGDLVQFAALVGTSNCPGSPRYKFLAGRKPATQPAKEGFVPGTTDSVSKMLHRIRDAGFEDYDLVAMLASHSIGRADSVDPSISGAPFDSTPNSLDGQFYLEVMFKGTGYPGTDSNFGEVMSGMSNKGELRLQSDAAVARDRRTACQWQEYTWNQKRLSGDFGEAMFKISMVGQWNRWNAGKMYDCSGAVPVNPTTPPTTIYPFGKSRADVEKVCRMKMPRFETAATDSNIPADE